jgi:hypothetical protein
MNTLGYRCIEDNGLSFELLVDGQPLGILVGAGDTAIPYWIVEGDLPYFPPNSATRDRDLRIVAVCSCGEYGCGHTRCRVVRSEQSVVFRDFDLNCNPGGRLKQLTFSKSNYESVVSEIVARARERRDRDADGR